MVRPTIIAMMSSILTSLILTMSTCWPSRITELQRARNRLLTAYFSGLQTLVLALLVGVANQLGDLVESLLKRDAKVKDSSMTIPGHGGILDRVDSLTYAAPAFFHFFRYFFTP